MAFTYHGAVTGFSEPSDATVSTSAIAITAGDLIVCYVGWRAGTTTITSVTDGGSNALTIGDITQNGNANLAFCYKIGAAVNAAAVFTSTLADAEEYHTIVLMNFHPTAGSTVTLDAGPSIGTGTDDTSTSGTLTTTGTDEVCIGGVRWGGYVTTANWKIGGVAKDDYFNAELGAIWYKLATGTDIAATSTGGAGKDWVCSIVAFKGTAAGGGQGAMKRFGGVPHVAVNRGVW